MMRTSDTINELAAALAKAQADLKNIHRDANNTFFKSKYAPLDAVLDGIRPVLAKYGIAFIQAPAAEGPRITVTTRLVHGTGQWIESDLTGEAKDAGPQSVGSATTYLRRYAIMSMAGVAATDDDDAEATEGRQGTTSHQSRTEAVKDKVAAQNGTPKRADMVKARMAQLGVKDVRAKAKEILGHEATGTAEDLDALEAWVQAQQQVHDAAAVLGGTVN